MVGSLRNCSRISSAIVFPFFVYTTNLFFSVRRTHLDFRNYESDVSVNVWEIGMIKRRPWLAISSNSNCFSRFRHLGDCFMAAASNFMLGPRDFQMSLRRISSNVSTSSVIDISNGRLFTNGFRIKGCCSENYGNVLRNNNDFKNDRGNANGNGNGVQKARAYGPCVPQLLRVSEEVVKVEDQQKSLNSKGVNGGGAANRGNFTGFLDQPSQEKIMIAVDVDEGIWFFIIWRDLKFLFVLCSMFIVYRYDLLRWQQLSFINYLKRTLTCIGRE